MSEDNFNNCYDDFEEDDDFEPFVYDMYKNGCSHDDIAYAAHMWENF